ncbi:SsgA family sporulation/cell division regulator [Amycolatopsis sp. NPDC051372]|uniref:SsgA family sporulation/cell division regulator n=1 Tax=Amycolatopsis sp. NPDC051372 TaxID=3155669 RepID=UPI003430FBD7
MTNEEPDRRNDEPAASGVNPLALRIHRVLRISMRIPPTPGHATPRALHIYRLVEHPLRLPLNAEFRFDTTSPFTVAATFKPNGEPQVTWDISRELLWSGLHGKTGAGDVQTWPTVVAGRHVLRLRLAANGVTAVYEVDLDELTMWLEKTCELVPPGEETLHVDWDAFASEVHRR